MKTRFKNIKVQMLVAAGALTSGAALASGAPDSTAAVAAIGGFGDFAAAVGGAMVLVAIAIRAWRKIGG
ncbi:TPA: hypothetical protein ACVU43_000007 [Vibrio parahaemolyticus]|uniref:hypothetical protein n=1 Tax=Vibrio parahaemolyticus TaxID=670 RepID=UPI00215BBD59|nr:hypothetical protein [Vibrio parahaemolyticus]EKO3832917.1 hypothetical protein [Vibrio harveyi]MCS0043871.1 hypothetical protein [Vibrio parahaemolyticus]